LKGELKRKIKFTKGSKIKIKRIRVRFENKFTITDSLMKLKTNQNFKKSQE
jgi:hypothetical protein